MMKTARPHTVFLSQSVKNMLINYREHLPFKSDFIFARARNLKRESGENSVRILRLIHATRFSRDIFDNRTQT